MNEQSLADELERHATRIISLPNFHHANPLSILGLPSTATFDECKQSYRRLSYLFHPDKHVVSHISEALHFHLTEVFPGLNAFEEVFKLLKLLEDPTSLSLYSHQLAEASRKRKAPRPVKRNKPSKLFDDHDTEQYQNFSDSCSSLLSALSDHRALNSLDIISQLKATVREPTVAKSRRGIPTTVDEVLLTHPGIAQLNERVRGAPAPAPVPLPFALVEDEVETLVVGPDGIAIQDIPVHAANQLPKKKKRATPSSQYDIAPTSAPKRQKANPEPAAAAAVAPLEFSLHSFSALLDTLPEELRKPFL